MKLKGISGVEQHFEKGIVGGVGVVLIGILGMQFLVQPNLVTIGKSQPLQPGNAYQPAEASAQTLQGKLSPEAGQSLLPQEPKVSLLAQYQEKMQKGVAPRPQLAMLGPAVNLGDAAVQAGPRSDSPITLAALPAPASPSVYAYAATIDPLAVVTNTELRKVLPPQQPYDKQWVSVEATFDGTALKTALEADPDGAGPARAVPRGWYENSIEILGVQLERQKLSGDNLSAAINGQIDAGNENWSDATLVPDLPGSTNLVGKILTNVKTMTDLAGELSAARNASIDVLRPEFFPTIAGPKWLPPSEARQADESSQGKNPIDVLNEQIKEQERQLKIVDKQMTDLGGGGRAAPPDRRQEGGGGGKGGGRESGGPSPSGASQKRNETKQKQLEARRDAATKKIAELQEKIEKIKNGGAGRQDLRKDEKSLLADNAVRMWAHDASAEPGSVYRYRTRVVLNNPLFGRTGLSDDAVAKNPIIYSEWSDWTEPVMVMPTEVYFVASGSPRSPTVGSVSASAECYRFYYGFYRKGSAMLRPGDMVRTTARPPQNLMVFDEEKLKAGARLKETSAPERGTSGPGGGKGPGGTPRGETPDEPGIAGGDGKESAPDDQNGLLKPAAKELPIFVRDVFLDTTELPLLGSSKPEGEQGQVCVLFRGKDGRLAQRVPTIEHGSLLYRQIKNSADQGVTQGQPKPEEKKPEQAPAEDRRRRAPKETETPGSGGG